MIGPVVLVIVVVLSIIAVVVLTTNVYPSFIKASKIYNMTPLSSVSLDMAEGEVYDDVEIVCARYNRDVSFLDKLPYRSNVVQKDIDVVNIGNEATSYLWWILKRYDDLPNVTVFIHDEDESWHHEGKLTKMLPPRIRNFKEKEINYDELNSLIWDDADTTMKYLFFKVRETDYWDKILRENLNYGDMMEYLPCNRRCCAQFIVSKKAILSRPKKFYQDMYDWLLKEGRILPNEVINDSWYRGLVAEWTWFAAFNDRIRVYAIYDGEEGCADLLDRLKTNGKIDYLYEKDRSKEISANDYDIVIVINKEIGYNKLEKNIKKFREGNEQELHVTEDCVLYRGYQFRYISK